MLKYIKFLSLIIIATFGLSSCSNETIYPKEKVDAYFDSVIAVGQTKNEVEAIFGKPYKTANDEAKGLVYTQYNLLDAKNPAYVEGVKYDKWEVWSSFHHRFIAYKDNVVADFSDNYDLLRGIKSPSKKRKRSSNSNTTHITKNGSSITINSNKSVSCVETDNGTECTTY